MKRYQILTAALLLTLVALASYAPAAQKSIDGKWNGVASAGPDGDIYFSIAFKTVEGKLSGTINIPDLGMYDTALTGLSFDGKTLNFGVPTPEGDVDCTAKLESDGTISGTYDQMGTIGSFTMKRDK
jgi:hypothetical protein